ncbi:MAG TPA: hypothetical protein DDY49_00200 [Paenibacillaceae bacterium]|nr:hypothetical protein [Paenibacillaceae bacterium]
MAEKTCCVASRLEIPTDKLDDVRREQKLEIGAALEDGYRTFVSGFEEGVGMLFYQLVNERRGEYPDIFLEVILHPDHCEGFNRADWQLISKSNGIKFLSKELQMDYLYTVTRYTVGVSERVIAVYDGQADRVTLYAMNYAHSLERDLRIIEI